jgi:hypothetical protein
LRAEADAIAVEHPKTCPTADAAAGVEEVLGVFDDGVDTVEGLDPLIVEQPASPTPRATAHRDVTRLNTPPG